MNQSHKARGISRRDVMKMAAAGMLAPIFARTNGGGMGGQLVNAVRRRGHLHPMMKHPHLMLDKFVDALPIPDVIRPARIVDGVAQYDVTMTEFKQKLHKHLPPTTLWGYEGCYPGPTFEARRGQPIDVTWRNRLPSRHLLEAAYDDTIHGADMGEPHSRTVVHLHGAKVMPDSDGYPEAWFTNGFARTGPAFARRTYTYPNDQPATTLWYHDHALGITRLNVFTGLEGFYLIRDEDEEGLNLPSGRYEIPLMIQDRSFNPDGSLFYPTVSDGTHKLWIPEYFGNVAVVNGKVWPYLDVEPRKYRFRILNGSNARFWHMSLKDASGNPGPTFHQIGADAGLMAAPVEMTDVLIAPAERFDVVIDFSRFAGQTLVLANDAPGPFPGGDVDNLDIMQFRVRQVAQRPDNSSLPSRLAAVPPLDAKSAVVERTIMLSEADRDPDGFPEFGLIGGSPTNATIDNPTGGLHWHDPVTEAPTLGSTEIWNFVNVTTDAHPIHVHLVRFQVLDRRTFDLDKYLNTGVLDMSKGVVLPPDPNERGAWKDTVKCYSGVSDAGDVTGLVTRVIMKFETPSGARVTPGDRLRYVVHCHILEHEDVDMMRPYDVVVP